MRIEKLLLQRFCQHTKLEIDFSPGLNVIIGPIGSGKSNILKAIRLLFTNSSGNSGVREADIQQGSSKSDRSGVQMVGWHNRRFFLSKGLQPANREFYWEGSEIKLKSEKDIATEIANTMGFDPSLFDEFVMVPQGEIANIIDMTDAARSDAMQKLVGLQKYAKLHLWLGNYLTGGDSPTTYVDPDAIQSQINELEATKAGYVKELGNLKFADEASLEKASEIIKGYQLSIDLHGRAKTLREEVAARQANLPVAEASVKEIEASLQRHSVSASEAESELKKLNDEYQSHSAYLIRDRATQEIARLTLAATPPAPLQDYAAADSAESALLNSSYQQLQVLLHIQKLSQSGSSVCPTCLRGIDSAFHEPLKEIPVLQARCDSLRSQLQRSRDYDNAVLRANQAKQTADASIPGLQQQIADAPEGVRSDRASMLSALVKSAIDKREAAVRKVNETHTLLTSAKVLLSNEAATLDKCISSLAALDDQKVGVQKVSHDDYAWATKLKADNEMASHHEARLTGAITVIDQQLPSLLAQKKKALEDKEKADADLEFRHAANPARDLLHRDEIPFEMAKSSMLAVAVKMNETLEAFSAKYRVSAGIGAGFKANFFGDYVKSTQDDTRLSGGERAQFGLALRIAAHSIWAQDLGFLALDEPTYGFGQADMSCVSKAIEQLRNLSNDQGLQVIVVTHEKSLVPLFDNVITLE